MAKRNVQSEGKTVEELFGVNVVYSMPEFQRGYVWKPDNLKEYWKDMKNLTKEEGFGETSFLGALVLQEASSHGENKTEGPPARYIVIDGQQRLTTFYLTLLALLVYATKRVQLLQEQKSKGEKVDEIDKQEWKDYANDDQHRNFLFFHESEDGFAEIKIKPTRDDKPKFTLIVEEFEMLGSLLEGNKPHNLLSGDREETGKLFEAYRFLQKAIKSFIIKGSSDAAEQRDRYNQILQALINRTEVVQIITGPNLSPNKIFDRLNTSGVRLGTLDWVRNDIYGRLPSDKELPGYEDFSTAIWVPFENNLKDVPEITDTQPFKSKNEEKQEKEKQKRKEKREANQSENFFKAYGTIVMKNNFKVKDKFGCLKGHWDVKINETPSLYEQHHYPYGEAEIIVKILEEHLPSYLALCAEKEPDGINLDLWNLIKNMKELSFPELTYPFLMPVIRSSIEGELPVPNAIQAFKIVESFLVRRTLGGLDRGGLTPVFKNLWTNCEAEKMTPELILQSIKKSAGAHFYEDDEEVKRNIHKVSVDGKDGVRYILMQYEKKLRQKYSTTYPPLHECGVGQIISKAESEVGEPIAYKEKEKERENLCGTLGNLTLLDPKIMSHGGVKERGVKKLLPESELLSVKELGQYLNTWNTKKIKQRGEELGKWVVERWPLEAEKF